MSFDFNKDKKIIDNFIVQKVCFKKAEMYLGQNGHSGNDYKVAKLFKLYLTVTGIYRNQHLNEELFEHAKISDKN